MPRLTRQDFATDPVTLAKALIGCRLIRSADDGDGHGSEWGGVIVETEAYCGVEDKAAHSVGWRRTERTEPMFGPPGTSYVFLTYGMHFLFNAVCGEVDEPVAVLLRAVDFEGEAGVNIGRARRERAARSRASKPAKDHELGSGPAKLCQALAIERSLNMIDLATDPRLRIEPGPYSAADVELANGPRIGVGSAQEWADKPLRWWVVGNRAVSLRDGVRAAAGQETRTR
ncbi:MAG: DNA-3-methyladenine glycosylase [Planctomycetota bacterium]